MEFASSSLCLGGFFVLWLASEVLRVYVRNGRDMGFAEGSD